ncbi:MAG: 30S ribosome-binding factor RbfA [Verrucomicrobia bacterium]|nr:30S ribosome-binding factor RbfA [Verrucomicrobiota bacterium]MDA1067152.1 30S ribosome-binding factor RbfA [Verrucomicrobiota bacterium]
MGQRNLRVNVLVKQEVSQLLHTRYQGQTVFITITDVLVSPDLRNGRVYYAVIGGEEEKKKASRFFHQNARDIRDQLSKNIVLKYLPFLTYHFDDSIARGVEIIELIDQVTDKDSQKENL